MSAQKFTVIVKPAPEGGYIAQCLEVPLVCQARTKEEALKNIQQAIESTGWKLKQNY